MSVEARQPTAIEVEHLFDLSVELEPPQVIATPFGTRMTYVVRSGRFAGPRLRGEILPGGGDWLLFGNDGIGRLDVRATMRTDDAELIHLTTTGVAALPDEVRARLLAGEHITADEMYTRSQLRFETGSPAYAWLNSAITVAINELAPNHVDYRVYRVL